MDSRKRKNLAILEALCANIIFGASFLFSKLALEVADTFILLSVRFIIAFALLNLLVLVRVGKISLKGKAVKPLLLIGLIQPFLYFIGEQYGIKYTSSAFAGIMIGTIPVVVLAFAAIFLKELPTKTQVLFAVLSLLGVSAISLLGGESVVTVRGVLLLCFAVLVAAVFSILARKLPKSVTAFERTYVMFAIGAVCFTFVALGKFGGGYFGEVARAFASPNFVLALLYLSVVSSIIAFLLFNDALTRITLAQSTSFANVTTVVSVVAGIVFLKEPFSPLQAAFAGLIIVSVWGVNRFVRKDAGEMG